MHRCPPEPKSQPEIFVLEDERGVRDVITAALTGQGYEVVCFADAGALIATARKRIPACIVLDVFVPGKSGLELLRELHAEGYPAPVVVISGRSDIKTAVSAMKLGALDFIEKPFVCDDLVARIDAAIEFHAEQQGDPLALGAFYFPGTEPLTRREREVLGQFVQGASSKEAGRALAISSRTVDDHRSHIMRKLGAKNFADLIRIALIASRRPSGRRPRE